MTELVGPARLEAQRPLDRLCALGDDHDREVRAPLVPVADPLADLVDVERPLRDEDDVGPAGHPRVDRDPPGVATHHLDDHHPVVALRGGVQPVDGIGRDLHRGVEPEGVVGRRQVVVDRLRHADDVRAVGPELRGDAEGVLTADRDQRVDPLPLEGVEHARDAVVGAVGIGARRPEDRPAPRAGSRACDASVRSTRLVLDHAAPAVAEAEHAVAVLALRPCGRSPRMTALSPGQSPPPVSTPTLMRILLRRGARPRPCTSAGTRARLACR